MNRIFLTTILILCLPAATALYGGETWTYYFPFCSQLKVNVTGTLDIHDGEYIMPDNCVENKTNYYICSCTDDYYFNVSFKTNAVNNYTFDFDYYYNKSVADTTPTVSSGGGGGGGYTTPWNCSNWSECIDNKIKRVCIQGTNKNINYTQSRSCVSETKEPKEKEEVKVEEEINVTTEPVLVIEKNETKNETEVDIPTKEQESWIYIGIILITVLFIGIGLYIIYKRGSGSNSE